MDKLLFILVGEPFIGAFVCYLAGKWRKPLRDVLVWVVTFGELALMLYAAYRAFMLGAVSVNGAAGESITMVLPGVCGLGLSFRLDGFRVIYGLVAAFMWSMTSLFSPEYFAHYKNRNRYYLFTLLTLGATMGVFLSADLFTTYVFFEIMSLTSYVWVAQDEREESLRAAETYLAVAVIGGMVLLMGLFLLQHCLGTLQMDELLLAARASDRKLVLYVAGVCTFVGFGAKAGAFPLHIWLPKAHPVAPAPASALLSGILTKSGIFGLLVVTGNIFLQDMNWGCFLMILGTITMLWGAILAVVSVDLKRTLACSSMSQLGFIILGIGMMCMPGEGAMLGVHGVLLHMVNHSLLKLVLFMAAGVVFMNLHELDLNEIRGFGRKKPLLHAVFFLGAYGLACLPLGNGYISKTLLHECIAEWIGTVGANPQLLSEGMAPFFAEILGSVRAFRIVEWLFLLSGGCTVAYMLKLYIVLFIEKNNDEKKQKKYDEMKHYMNVPSAVALIVSALPIPLLGLFPGKLTNRIGSLGEGISNITGAEGMEGFAHYTSWEALKGSVISIIIGVILYVFVVRLIFMRKEQQGRVYVNGLPRWMDLEELVYRPFLLVICRHIGFFFAAICDTLIDGMVVFLRKTIYRDRALPYERMEGDALTDSLGALFDDCREWRRRNQAKARKIYGADAGELAVTGAGMEEGKREEGKKISFRHRFAVLEHEIVVTYGLIERSMSFGLMLFCVGLVATLLYLLWLM